MTAADIAHAQTMLPVLMLASVRPGAAFLAAPVFGFAPVPVLVRFGVAVAIGVPSATATPMPYGDLLSVSGLLIVAGEAVIGLILGFALQTGFAAASIAGEAIGNAMGLGFASMIDPASGRATPAMSQALSIVATLLFLSIDGHLAFVAVIVDSHRVVPLGSGMPSLQALGAVIALGGAMFAAAMSIALPVITGVMLLQLVMALLARSAPAMNLFAVGLPAALVGGMILCAFALPVMGQAITRTIMTVVKATGSIG